MIVQNTDLIWSWKETTLQLDRWKTIWSLCSLTIGLYCKRESGRRGAGKAEDIGNGSSFLSDQAETDVIRWRWILVEPSIVEWSCLSQSKKWGRRLLDLVAERFIPTAHNLHSCSVREEVHRWAHVLTPLNHELQFSTWKKNQPGINRKLFSPNLILYPLSWVPTHKTRTYVCIVACSLLFVCFIGCPFLLFISLFSSSHCKVLPNSLFSLDRATVLPLSSPYKPLASWLASMSFSFTSEPQGLRIYFSPKDAVEKFCSHFPCPSPTPLPFLHELDTPFLTFLWQGFP